MIRTLALRHTWRDGPTLAYPDLQCPGGQTLLLRGPSGSGKSTWLALLAGLLTPTDGLLEVAGVQPALLKQSQ
ncbi:MAG: ATP-binding cassette domain-containing protein, partial [Serpentinimonas sp.]|nr:ATP-binding cassette domain-containing protein [Serpentinimonas sp.]